MLRGFPNRLRRKRADGADCQRAALADTRRPDDDFRLLGPVADRAVCLWWAAV